MTLPVTLRTKERLPMLIVITPEIRDSLRAQAQKLSTSLEPGRTTLSPGAFKFFLPRDGVIHS